MLRYPRCETGLVSSDSSQPIFRLHDVLAVWWHFWVLRCFTTLDSFCHGISSRNRVSHVPSWLFFPLQRVPDGNTYSPVSVHARNLYPSVLAFMPRGYDLFFLPFLGTLVLDVYAAIDRSSLFPFFLGELVRECPLRRTILNRTKYCW